MRGTRSAFLGGMIGSALGDAVGELAFSAGSRESLERMIERTGTLRYTDDTAMAMGIAESICERGGLDSRHLGDTFRRNFRREPWRGYASGPPAVFSAVERAGLSYRQAAASLDAGGFCGMLVDFARTDEIRGKMEQVGKLVTEQAPPGRAASVLGRGIAVQESMPFAVFSFLRYPVSYRDCLLCAVLNRGDCDTLGAMACGISGAYLGIEAVPEEWRGKLENRGYIEELALRLWELSEGH